MQWRGTDTENFMGYILLYNIHTFFEIINCLNEIFSNIILKHSTSCIIWLIGCTVHIICLHIFMQYNCMHERKPVLIDLFTLSNYIYVYIIFILYIYMSNTILYYIFINGNMNLDIYNDWNIYYHRTFMTKLIISFH